MAITWSEGKVAKSPEISICWIFLKVYLINSWKNKCLNKAFNNFQSVVNVWKSKCSKTLPKQIEEWLFLEVRQRNIKISQLWIHTEETKEINNGII